MGFLALPDGTLQPMPHSKLTVTILQGLVLKAPAVCVLQVWRCQHAQPTPRQGSTADLRSSASTSRGSSSSSEPRKHIRGYMSSSTLLTQIAKFNPLIFVLLKTKKKLQTQIFFFPLKIVWQHHSKDLNIHLDSYFCHNRASSHNKHHWKMWFSKTWKLKIVLRQMPSVCSER